MAHGRRLPSQVPNSSLALLSASHEHLIDQPSSEWRGPAPFDCLPLPDPPAANAAYRLSFACFFGGVLITAALDVAVHALMHRAARHRQQKAEEVSSVCSASESTAGLVRSLPWSDGHAKPGAGQGDLQLGRIDDPIHSYEAVHSGSGPDDVETGRTGGSGIDCNISPRSHTSGAGNAAGTGTASACQAPARSCSECMHKDSHAAMPAPGTVSSPISLLWQRTCVRPAAAAARLRQNFLSRMQRSPPLLQGSAQLMAMLQGDEHTNEMLQATLRSGELATGSCLCCSSGSSCSCC